jgi:hypothetical protein
MNLVTNKNADQLNFGHRRKIVRLYLKKLKLQYHRMEKRFEYKTTVKVEQTERMRTNQNTTKKLKDEQHRTTKITRVTQNNHGDSK